MAKDTKVYPLIHDSALAMQVDGLLALKDQMDVAKAKYDVARDLLEPVLADGFAGSTSRAQVFKTVAETERVDWKAVAMAMNPSQQLLTAHTTKGSTTTVKVSPVSAAVLAVQQGLTAPAVLARVA